MDAGGHPYWYNDGTGESTYEDPAANWDSALVPSGATHAAVGGGASDGGVSGGGYVCEQCGDAAAKRWCDGCGRSFCAECFDEVHRSDPSKRDHTFQKM